MFKRALSYKPGESIYGEIKVMGDERPRRASSYSYERTRNKMESGVAYRVLTCSAAPPSEAGVPRHVYAYPEPERSGY